MRRAARVDSTQAAIKAGLAAFGADVWVIELPVDLLVGYKGRTYLMECKSLIGKREPKPARYTKLQAEFMQKWDGSPVITVTSAEEAVAAILRG
jgi:hypothetical protein